MDRGPRASLIIAETADHLRALFRWVKMTEEKGGQMCGRTVLRTHLKVKGDVMVVPGLGSSGAPHLLPEGCTPTH